MFNFRVGLHNFLVAASSVLCKILTVHTMIWTVRCKPGHLRALRPDWTDFSNQRLQTRYDVRPIFSHSSFSLHELVRTKPSYVRAPERVGLSMQHPIRQALSSPRLRGERVDSLVGLRT